MCIKLSFRKVTGFGIFLLGMTVVLLSGCGGDTTGGTTSSQTYTASAGVGEVLKFVINKTKLTYSYTVIKTSYASAGVTEGQTGTGTLTDSGGGFYAVGASSDSFIQGGKFLPLSSGLLSGHVQISDIGGTVHIPVIGVSNPITDLASLAGTYNFQGFACSALSIADVTGNGACSTNYGTMSVDASGNVFKCNQGNNTTTACVTSQNRTLQVIAAAPGVFDFSDATTGHAGWFFAFTAANGQKVAILDNDDASALVYGQAVLSTYASSTSGDISGTYFKNDNENSERTLTISGTTYSNDLGFSGTIAYNSPWEGMSTFSVTDGVTTVTGMGMTSAAGVYTHLMDGDPQFFSSGVKQ